MFCESCGSQVPDGQSFCSNCGAPVVQAAPQPAAQPAQPVYQQPVAQPVQPVVQVQPVVVQAAQPAPAAKSSGLAIAGLIMGIFTLIFCWVPVVGFILGVLGLIFSIAGIAKKNGGAKGAAIAGLIMTIIGAIISVVMLGAVLTAGTSSYIDAAESAAAEYESYSQSIEDEVD
jgi:hypothetical protein